jgi:hypothetical protein
LLVCSLTAMTCESRQQHSSIAAHLNQPASCYLWSEW